MLRTCRSHLLPILWGLSIFFSFYNLFDLLDIDGSKLKIPSPSASVTEERVTGEEERIHLAVDFLASPTPLQSPLARQRLSSFLAVIPTGCQRAPFLVSHPRNSPAPQVASCSERDSDPAQRKA